MPCTTPPAIWPSTTSGLMSSPQSSTTTYRGMCTRPVCEVDLDPAHVRRLRPAALAAVPYGATIASPERRARRGRAATSANDTEIDGTPATCIAPLVDHEVVARRLEQVGGDVEDALAQRARRDVTAPPAIGRRAAAAGARQPERRDRGVAEAHAHLLDRERRARRPRPGRASSRGPGRAGICCV